MLVQEKMKEYGMKTLSNKELISLIIKGKNVIKTSDKVMESLPQQKLCYLSDKPVEELTAIIGEKSAFALCAAVELGRRINKEQAMLQSPDFSSPENVATYLMEDMRHLKQECFVAVYLSTKNRLICTKTLTVGTLNASFAKSREVFRYALQYNAAAVILLHNHPSGDPEPSHEDIKVTNQIAEAGQIMEIPVLDHIVIGDGIYVSLCERGYL